MRFSWSAGAWTVVGFAVAAIVTVNVEKAADKFGWDQWLTINFPALQDVLTSAVTTHLAAGLVGAGAVYFLSRIAFGPKKNTDYRNFRDLRLHIHELSEKLARASASLRAPRDWEERFLPDISVLWSKAKRAGLATPNLDSNRSAATSVDQAQRYMAGIRPLLDASEYDLAKHQSAALARELS